MKIVAIPDRKPAPRTNGVNGSIEVKAWIIGVFCAAAFFIPTLAFLVGQWRERAAFAETYMTRAEIRQDLTDLKEIAEKNSADFKRLAEDNRREIVELNKSVSKIVGFMERYSRDEK